LKILTIVGARPQFVKAAVVSRAFAKSSNINEIILHTGQHFDKNMSDIFFEEMEIPKPKYNLNVNGLSHGAMTGEMLKGIEQVCLEEKPDYLMVYGDTNSTIAGALAAKKLKIKVVHIEAGLRSFNLDMPEEINRILTDRISDFLFCPTDTAVQNLLNEGISPKSGFHVIQNGDVMQDAAMYYAQNSSNRSNVMKEYNLSESDFALCTIHRQENTDNIERLMVIIDALNEIQRTQKVIVPLHPRTKKIIESNNLKPEFLIIDPVGYFDMIELLKGCNLVLTDSGGLQKEAYFFNKFCITMREETEWVELVQNNFNVLTGANKVLILQAFHKFLNKPFIKSIDLYGGGKASDFIRETLENLG
jgi:UDP-GlcNAc3NAcA epimerase